MNSIEDHFPQHTILDQSTSDPMTTTVTPINISHHVTIGPPSWSSNELGMDCRAMATLGANT